MTVSLPLLAVVAALQSPLPLVLAQSSEGPQIIRGPRRARPPETKAAQTPAPAPCTRCAADVARARALDARESELSAREKAHGEAAEKQARDEAARKKKEEAEARKQRKQLEDLSRQAQEGFREAANALAGE